MSHRSTASRSTQFPVAEPIGILGASSFHDRSTADKRFTHLVVLFNARTEHEKTIWVETDTDRFSDVLDAVLQVKRDKRLWGYEIFETLEVASYVKAEF